MRRSASLDAADMLAARFPSSSSQAPPRRSLSGDLGVTMGHLSNADGMRRQDNIPPVPPRGTLPESLQGISATERLLLGQVLNQQHQLNSQARFLQALTRDPYRLLTMRQPMLPPFLTHVPRPLVGPMAVQHARSMPIGDVEPGFPMRRPAGLSAAFHANIATQRQPPPPPAGHAMSTVQTEARRRKQRIERGPEPPGPDPLESAPKEFDIEALQQTFPVKLFRILQNAEEEGYDDVISFSSDGLSFRIHDRKRFAAEVVPKFSNHNSMASFRRQLSLYGFQKDQPRGPYQHRLFRRDRPDVLQFLRRVDYFKQG